MENTNTLTQYILNGLKISSIWRERQNEDVAKEFESLIKYDITTDVVYNQKLFIEMGMSDDKK